MSDRDRQAAPDFQPSPSHLHVGRTAARRSPRVYGKPVEYPAGLIAFLILAVIASVVMFYFFGEASCPR